MTDLIERLRALADALEPMAKAPRFEDFDVPAFCAWVRACADAQPVAWVDVTDSYGGPYVFHGKELLPAGRHDLYTHPAPAAPQAEPLSDVRIAEIQRAAYERAAQECEAQISGSDHHYLATHGHWDHMAQAATNCAAAINEVKEHR